MKSSCYFIFNHSGTSELKILLDSLLQLMTDSQLVTCNCPRTNSVTAFTSLISTLHRPHRKHRLYCWWHHHLCRSVFTKPLLRNGLHNPAVPLLLGTDDTKTQPHLLLRVGLCLQSCCLARHWSNPLQYSTRCGRTCDMKRLIWEPCILNYQSTLMRWNSNITDTPITKFFQHLMQQALPLVCCMPDRLSAASKTGANSRNLLNFFCLINRVITLCNSWLQEL
jgi:hypothetical protein